MKCISANITILAILFFMPSCIREDTPNCNNSTLRLRFQYTLNNQYSDLFDSEIHQITAYIFDIDNKYVGKYSETDDKLTRNYIMSIPLPKGSYQAVIFCDNLNTFTTGWIDSTSNSFNPELHPGITTISDFRIMLDNTEDTDGYLTPVTIPGDLYAGYVANALSTYDTSYITDVDLMKDTKNIIIKISGLDFPNHSTVVPQIYITGVNGRYKSDNSIDISHRTLKYTPHNTSVTGNKMESKLKTMRIVKGHELMLVIKHPSIPGYIFNQDITELISSIPQYASQKDIDREDTFVFKLYMNLTGGNIVISILINGWQINSIIPVNN